MKFLIERHLLETTLNNISRGLSTKTPLPVLTGIYIKAEREKLIFITTNKEISIRVEIPVSENLSIDEQGVCVVPGKYFIDIVKKIEGNNVEFTLFDTSTIKILSRNSDFTLIPFDSTNFPRTEFEPFGSRFQITCKDLKQIIKQTSFACATSENRIILTSLNFTIKGQQLTAIATDSFRLSKKIFEFADSYPNIQMNVPCRSIEEFTKIIPDSDEEIDVYVDSNHILFKYENLAFLSRLVEGLYPNTSSIVPQQFLLEVKFDRAELMAATDRASLFTELDSLNLVKITFKASQETAEIASNSTEMGRVVETVSVLERSEKLDFQIAFSSKHLLDALKAVTTDTIVMKFTGEIRAAVLYGEGDESLVQFLIPVRIF